jgi:CBS domain-containing protein
MSELQKHTKAISSEPLFLQDREGKLFGELTPWRILESLAHGADDHDQERLSDDQVGVLLRRDFTQPIRTIARTDVVPHPLQASLARLLETSVKNDQTVIPICDEEGRIKGLVSADDLLRGLVQSLSMPAATNTDAPGPSPGPGPGPAPAKVRGGSDG